MADQASGTTTAFRTDITPARFTPPAIMVQPWPCTSEQAAEESARTRAAFPAWNVWRSDEGCWWATRNRPLPPSRWPDSYALTVTAGDPFGLREQLSCQPE
jgi:hypothetical protein